ncbi:MAG TPA: hypothetical protein DCM87_04655, partial [Planctomycetes bacterium]|nr:hypothetical protein [Planctomycetota bacterium]
MHAHVHRSRHGGRDFLESSGAARRGRERHRGRVRVRDPAVPAPARPPVGRDGREEAGRAPGGAMNARSRVRRRRLPRRSFCAALGAGLALAGCKRKENAMGKQGADARRVVVLGLDGVDPALLARFRGEGALPNFDALAREGGFAPLATSNPAQSPVAWATLGTGVNPGRHGVFDFLHRDP